MYEFSTFMQIYICMHDTRVNACMSMWVQLVHMHTQRQLSSLVWVQLGYLELS